MEKAVTHFAGHMMRVAQNAGAMPKNFIGVGSAGVRDELCKLLSARDWEIIPGEFTAMALLPDAFRSHRGTHFNRKLFVLNGLDTLVEKLGEEVLRRLNFEQRMFTRTATWSLTWIETRGVAALYRTTARGLWEKSDATAVFAPPNAVDGRSVDPWSCEHALTTVMGPFPVPRAVEQAKLSEIANAIDPANRSWADLLRLRTADFFLSVWSLLESGAPWSAELAYATATIAASVGQNGLASALQARLSAVGAIPEIEATPFPGADGFHRAQENGEWLELPEWALQFADRCYQDGKIDEALSVLNDYVNGAEGLYALAERPLRLRAILNREAGRLTDASADIDLCEKIALDSGLDVFLAAAYEARAAHVEQLGDVAQAERWRKKANELKKGES